MYSRTRIRFYLILGIFTSLFVFAFANILKDKFGGDKSMIDFVNSVWGLTSAIVGGLLSIVLIENKYIVKLILGDKYISGIYEGESKTTVTENVSKVRETNAVDFKHIEKFEIKQSLLGATISGHSSDANNAISSWEGVLFREQGRTFIFAVEISADEPEYGVLSLSFIDDNFTGFYYSGNPTTNHVSQMFGTKK